ncbi:MAG: malate dehydrogenase (quinone) [Mycobacterium sp.]
MPGAAKTDVVLVGAGIMSATLGAMLRRLEPDWSITLIERLDAAGAESSGPWNNAGTGHSGLCELFYTPEKAARVNEQFQISRQFWAYAVQHGMLADARSFVRPIPHAGFVTGADNVDQLRRRHDALCGNPLFAGIELIRDADEFARRLPLMATGRDFREPVGLSWFADGTDVDFGSLATQLIGYGVRNGTAALFGHEVRTLSRESDGSWTLRVRNRHTGEDRRLNAGFVFVGAGGGALPLLQKSGIKEAKGFGGFPIGGRFLRCGRPDVVDRHHAKVYGLPAPGAPSTTAPHLDARVVNGRPWLLFGPFADWSPKFLKYGARTDLVGSVKRDNLGSLLTAGVRQRVLIGYLIGQLRRSHADRVAALRAFAPEAVDADWETIAAGQRVQVIRHGELGFETTVVGAADGSIAGLLGASPGASTAVPVMLDVLAGCFPQHYRGWLPALKDMVPSLGIALSDNPALFEEIWGWGTRTLKLSPSADG